MTPPASSSDSSASTWTTKTVYLIRHAESEENRKLSSIKNAWRDISSFSLPTSKDLTTGLGWLNVSAQIDSAVSEVGQQQINEMAEILKRDNFLQRGIQLVAHSPLQRARETSRGVLGCAAPDQRVGPVQRVLELDLLEEKSPVEWFVKQSAFAQRLQQLEIWIHQQPEETMVLVGHSQFFKALLNLSFKFGNCDVWKVEFNGERTEKDYADELPVKWSNLKKLYSCQAVPSQQSAENMCGL